MMKTLAAFILLFAQISAAHATPVLLEKNHSNDAWGYQNCGCIIDELGYVYFYNIAKKVPVTRLQNVTVSPSTMSQINLLLARAARGKWTQDQVAADAGTYIWKGRYLGKPVNLKMSGDYVGMNTAPESRELAKLIDQYCSWKISCGWD